MDVFLGVLVLLMPPVALAAMVVPPIIIAIRRRQVVPAVMLHLAAVGSLVAWFAAGIADMDRADVTGAAGNAFAGAGWFLAAVLLAGAAIAVTRGTTGAPAPTL